MGIFAELLNELLQPIVDLANELWDILLSFISSLWPNEAWQKWAKTIYDWTELLAAGTYAYLAAWRSSAPIYAEPSRKVVSHIGGYLTVRAVVKSASYTLSGLLAFVFSLPQFIVCFFQNLPSMLLILFYELIKLAIQVIFSVFEAAIKIILAPIFWLFNLIAGKDPDPGDDDSVVVNTDDGDTLEFDGTSFKLKFSIRSSVTDYDSVQIYTTVPTGGTNIAQRNSVGTWLPFDLSAPPDPLLIAFPAAFPNAVKQAGAFYSVTNSDKTVELVLNQSDPGNPISYVVNTTTPIFVAVRFIKNGNEEGIWSQIIYAKCKPITTPLGLPLSPGCFNAACTAMNDWIDLGITGHLGVIAQNLVVGPNSRSLGLGVGLFAAAALWPFAATFSAKALTVTAGALLGPLAIDATAQNILNIFDYFGATPAVEPALVYPC